MGRSPRQELLSDRSRYDYLRRWMNVTATANDFGACMKMFPADDFNIDDNFSRVVIVSYGVRLTHFGSHHQLNVMIFAKADRIASTEFN